MPVRASAPIHAPGGDGTAAIALAFENLTLGYDRHPAVHHLSGSVPEGALLAVVGPNGAGKSTLLKAIAGLLPPMEGRIETPSTGSSDRIAYLPQSTAIDRSFPISVLDLVGTGLWRHTGAFGRLSRLDRERVADAIVAVGLAGLEHRPIGTLSGGQMQRALFARLILQDATLILLDEPFAAIDASTTADLVSLMRRWHEEGRTVIAVLHDLALVRSTFPQTLLLAREAVAWGATEAVLGEANLTAARRLLERAGHDRELCEEAA